MAAEMEILAADMHLEGFSAAGSAGRCVPICVRSLVHFPTQNLYIWGKEISH